jgi:hypothetical protein
MKEDIEKAKGSKAEVIIVKGSDLVPEMIRKHRAKASLGTTKSVDKPVNNIAPIHNLEVVHEEVLHSQPNHNLQVVLNTEEHIRENTKVNNLNTIKERLELVLNNQTVDKVLEFGMTERDIDECLTTLLAVYAAEGITPRHHHLVEGLMQMHRDAR